MPRGVKKASEGNTSDATLNEKIEGKDAHKTIDVISVSMGVKEDLEPYHDCIKVKIKYPKTFKGVKYYSDGDIVNISAESAEMFKKAGIGTIL